MKFNGKKIFIFTAKTIQYGCSLGGAVYATAIYPPTALFILGSVALTFPTVAYFRRRGEKKAFPVSSTAPLTSGEISLVKSVFGPKVTLDKVKKLFSPRVKNSGKDNTTLAQAFGKKAIKFYGNDNHAEDYSQTDDSKLRSLFMHEMTHVIQSKRPVRDFFNSLCRTKKYAYTLSEKSRFKRFGVEQQATIIEDYTRLFLHPGGYRPQKEYWPTCGDKKQNIELLKKVVEDRFPEASKSRAALEAQEPQNTLANHILSATKFDKMSFELRLDVVDFYFSFLRDADAAFLASPKGTLEEKTVALVEEHYPDFRETRFKWHRKELEMDKLRAEVRALEEQNKSASSALPPQAPRV